MNFFCETERLLLQVLTTNYAQQVLDFYDENREHLEPWEIERQKQYYTVGYQKAVLEAEYNLMVKGSMLRYYVFEKKQPHKIIGAVSAASIRYGAFSNCNIGYKIHREYCQNGYGKEAVACLERVLFEEYGMHRIEAMVHPKNAASIALLNGMGYDREGIAKEIVCFQGQWQDMYRYAKIAP